MTTQAGTTANPLRVAIVGSGPSGFYAAEHLQKQSELTVTIDMFDRLPTPYGLVRGGVAPDHPKIKSVTRVYDKIATRPGFRFFGNVEFGKDITIEDIRQHYHAVIFAVGAQTDKPLNIPGEDLAGSHAATEFVAWYNGHPDYREREFDLTVENVAVVGVGNVAMDVVRILARTVDELRETDIADYALDELGKSQVKNIYILGRRGPAQAAFTNPEIKELGEMADAEVIIDPHDMELDELSRASLEASGDRTAVRNVEILTAYANHPSQGKKRKIHMRFLVSPVELIGTDKVEAIKIVKNELYATESGSLRPRPTEEFETIPVGLVFRSVGYRGVPLPGVPFYDRWGTIPNDKGRVLTQQDSGETVTGNYVVGWIKRGPSGIIGTNKPDSVETANMLLEDLAAGHVLAPEAPASETIPQLLTERHVRYVTYADWQILDEMEQQRGLAVHRPRIKFSRVQDMLDALEKAKAQKVPNPAGD
ncbi:MAG: FAD-dependent oxidoreductase [Anaerolineae bacterium]|nr:FAD-dependent oxidoreductase [Anaerolineae bacterium]